MKRLPILTSYRQCCIPVIEAALRLISAVPATGRQRVSDSVDRVCLSLYELDEETREALEAKEAS